MVGSMAASCVIVMMSMSAIEPKTFFVASMLIFFVTFLIVKYLRDFKKSKPISSRKE